MEQYIADFEKEIRALKLNDVLEKELIDKAFSKLSFYTYIPYELYRVLCPKGVTLGEITKLTVASYTYFSFVLFFDKVKDKQFDALPLDEDTRNTYIQDYIFKVHEYVFKTLAHLFSAESGFWDAFEKLRFLFLCAKEKTVTDDNLIKTLLNKSNLSEAYIHAFNYLVKGKDERERCSEVLKSFSEAMRYFHIAFQLFDDYNDLREDISNGQLNYYLFKGRAIRKSYQNDEKFIKALYVSGIIPKGLEIVKKNALLAEKTFRNMGMDIHANWSRSLYEKALNIDHYVYALLCKARQIAAYSSEIANQDLPINEKMRLSIQFLMSQMKDDSWEDFLTNAGFGKNWVTGYILTQIAEGERNGELQEVFKKLIGSGGRYNEYLVEDADSTNFLVKAMTFFGEKPTKEIIDRWCHFRKPDGGFSTYYKNDIKRAMKMDASADFTGWFSPQCCVTAVSCWAASSYRNIPEVAHIYEASKAFLLSHQQSEGNWKSYWWSSDIYATAFSILALMDDQEVDKCVFNQALQYLIKTQHNEGYWDGFHEPSTFFTALAINVLIQLHIRKIFGSLDSFIEKGMTWLRKNQYEDGSWKTARILRIPFPEELYPENVQDWRRTSFGLNCVVDDHKRVFTTATVYQTLKNYAKYCI